MRRKRNKRVWNFKRSWSQDRAMLDMFGGVKKPKVDEGLALAQDLLSGIIDDIGLKEGVTLEDLCVAWATIVGPNISNNSEPIEIRNGTLRVRVTQPVIRFELQQRHKLLLSKIAEALPQVKILKLEITL